jgi:hypothetical protein
MSSEAGAIVFEADSRRFGTKRVVSEWDDAPGQWIFDFHAMRSQLFGLVKYLLPHWQTNQVPAGFWVISHQTRITLPYWIVFLPTAPLSSVLIIRILRHVRKRSGICSRCSYSLTGNTSGTCPECGTSIPQASRPA